MEESATQVRRWPVSGREKTNWGGVRLEEFTEEGFDIATFDRGPGLSSIQNRRLPDFEV